MENLKKVILFLGNVLVFIGKFPAFLLPASLKGYRTILFNVLAAIIGVLGSIDAIGMIDSICSMLNLIIYVKCSPETIKEIYAALVLAINTYLRTVTDTPVSKAK